MFAGTGHKPLKLDTQVPTKGGPLMGTHRLGDRLLTEPIAIHIERYGWHGKLDCVHGREFDEHCNDCQRWVRMAECDHQYITADGSCERCKKPEVVKVTMKEGSRYHCKACGFNVFATTGPDRCTCASPENTWRLPGQPVSQEKNPPLKPPLCAMTLPRNVLEAAVSLRHACMAMNLELKAIGIEGAQESLLMGDTRVYDPVKPSEPAIDLSKAYGDLDSVGRERFRRRQGLFHKTELPKSDRDWVDAQEEIRRLEKALNKANARAEGLRLNPLMVVPSSLPHIYPGLTPSEQVAVHRDNETTRKCLEAAKDRESGEGLKALESKRPDHSLYVLDEDLLADDA